MFRRFLGLVVALAVAVALLAGCGGGTGGVATIVFDWPADPSVTSVGVVVYEGALVAGSKIVNRPAVGASTTMTFTGLDSGMQRFYFCTYDTLNGSGNPTGFAHGEVDVQATAGTPARVTTVAEPAATFSVRCARPVIYIGETAQCTGTLRNPDGSYAVVASGRLYWTSNYWSIVSIARSSGVATGEASGSARITASFGEGGSPSASVDVTVTERPTMPH